MNAEFPVHGVPASIAVVNRIANSEDVDPLDLEPLYEAVDPEALDALAGTATGSDADVRIQFTYHQHEVTVTGEGVIHVEEAVPVAQTVA